MAAGVTTRLWEIADIVEMVESFEGPINVLQPRALRGVIRSAPHRPEAACASRMSRCRLDPHSPTARDGRASLRHDQGPDGSNPLPDEDAATGCRRDGIARAGLQSHARHEHLGRPTAHGGDEGIGVPEPRPSVVAEPPHTAGIRFKSTSRPKQPPNPEK